MGDRIAGILALVGGSRVFPGKEDWLRDGSSLCRCISMTNPALSPFGRREMMDAEQYRLVVSLLQSQQIPEARAAALLIQDEYLRGVALVLIERSRPILPHAA
jgi:hypothetical protein